MKVIHSRLARAAGDDGPGDWEYFGMRLAELAGIPPGARVLDVGTGGGSVLLPAAQQAGEGGRAIGLDLDPGWFRYVRPKVRDRGLGNTALVHMDAGHLGFADGRFDRVLCGFLGWDHCFDFRRAEFTAPDTRLAAIWRVLKPGGRLGISSWVSRSDITWFGEQFLSTFPGYVAGWERAEGRALRVYRESAEGYERILRAGGFQDVELVTETEAFVSADEEEWWGQVWGSYWWQHIDPVAERDPDKLQRFKEQVFEGLQQQKGPDGIRSSKTALFALGTRPP
jgi:ubiquinone/menaquinone biosynthesis C-methylase UbiE